ncbi:MAG: GNAT family N-acetyltransferase [Lachnospiraceae bacterium]|nr:GNAT family N-acetyltransferase [Lachnospiraceae bacterium]
MIGLRHYKSCDAEKIAGWVADKDVFLKWGGTLFGDFPISAERINEKYGSENGGCTEPDNFYPWTAFDDEKGVVGHFIMRYLHGDRKVLRFGWVVVDTSLRGKGYGAQMLSAGLKYAFEILGASVVTIGVYENNEPAHNCYRKIGFTDKELVVKEPFNVIEMEMTKDAYLESIRE